MSQVIEVDRVSKIYPLYARSGDRLREALSPFRTKYHREFNALRNVSLSVAKGECVGLIGMNGSGKSTLLQIIAGVVTPTSGSCTTQGRLSALLELGAGFNPEYSGIENARFQCALMGVNQKEVPQLLREIIDFADIGDYISQAVKTYSSGMYVRLAFATAIAVQPDILIVDEALAVGDIYFQTKCLAKIRELRDAGRTMLFVSHDPGAVKSLCDRAYLLHKGEILDTGSPDQVFNLYNSLIAVKSEAEILGKTQELRKRYGTGKIKIQRVQMRTKNGYANVAHTGDKVTLEIVFTAQEDVANPTIGISIRDRAGIEVFGTNNFVLRADFGLVLRSRTYVVAYELDLQLGQNQYTVAVAAHPFDNHVIDCFDWINDALVFRVLPSDDLRFSGSCRFEAKADCILVN